MLISCERKQGNRWQKTEHHAVDKLERLLNINLSILFPNFLLKLPNHEPLYKPNKPNSLTTPHALTFEPATSPATCNLILTISKGFVKTTCDVPAFIID